MSERSVARRYANALFDVAHKAGIDVRIGEELSQVTATVQSHPQLSKVFETPMVPPQKKRAIVEAIFGSSGMTAELLRLLLILADRDRLSFVPAIADAYAERLRAAQRIVPADVVTAVPLGDARRADLARALGRAVGAEIQMQDRVDPSIVGGVIARVGSVVYDGSVSTQLAKLRGQLLETGK